MRTSLAALFLLPTLFACSGSSSSPDLMPADLMPLLSQCGHPGDKGNSLGVGKFCTLLSDCGDPGTQTDICSSLGNGPKPSPDDTYFCTIYPCQTDGGPAQCGENATCVCGSGGGMSGCACTPDSCLGRSPDMK